MQNLIDAIDSQKDINHFYLKLDFKEFAGEYN